MPSTHVEGGTDFRAPDEEHVPDISSLMFDPIEQLGAPGYLGTRAEIEAELDMIAASIRTFHRLQADQVMKYCAGYTARLTEMQVLLHRREGTVEGGRQYVKLRTQQVERYITELDRQYKVASRLVEVMRQDLFMAGGQA